MTSIKSPRDHWRLEPGLAFLNHGSFGACPEVVTEQQARLRTQLELNPVRFLWRDIEARLDAARAAVAGFVGAGTETIAFVSNATSAVNAVLRSFPFHPGDEIVVTDHGYNACNNVAAAVAASRGARVVVATIPFPIEGPEAARDAVLAAVTARTRLVMIDHVTSPTALVLPVEEIVAALEPRGIAVLVDGAHAPGMLPLDLSALQPSYYTGNLHKWVCAPRGAGFLYARRDRQDGLQPAVISHGWNTPRPGRSRFHDGFDWQGTLDPTPWLTVPAALAFCEGLLAGGWPALRAHNHDLVCTARGAICERLGLSPPAPQTMLGSMATIPLPDRLQNEDGPSRAVIARIDPLQTALLERHGIEVPVVRFGSPARKWVRISAQAYNTMSEYVRLAEAIAAQASA